jgi:rhodanese-related sulfurtransferase
LIVRLMLGVGFGLGALSAQAAHGPGGPVLTLPPEYAKRLLDEGERPVFVDLRPIGEYERGRLPGARSVPIHDLRRRHAEIPRAGRVVLYCACPSETVQAAYQFLRDQGYRNVSVLEEGFPGWVQRGYPLER